MTSTACAFKNYVGKLFFLQLFDDGDDFFEKKYEKRRHNVAFSLFIGAAVKYTKSVQLI